MTLLRLTLLALAFGPILRAAPLLESTPVFPANSNGVVRHRIPGVVVTPKGTVLAYCEARKNNSSDWGEIEVRRRQ